MAKTSKQLEIRARHIYKPEIEVCPYCGAKLKERACYLWRKTVQQLDGSVYVASRAKECINPACDHRGEAHFSAAAQMVTVPECSYGLDVIAQIGWWRDREHLNREQIHARLQDYGVQLCEREVDHLYAHYQVLLGCSSRLDKQALGLPIAATVSDKHSSVRKALEEMWPDIPHQWCQSHYLGNLSAPHL